MIQNIIDYIEPLYENEILKLGFNFFCRYKVPMVNFSDNTIRSTVQDIVPYKVIITIDENIEIAGITCTCRVSQTKYCHHSAAVFYYLDEANFFKSPKYIKEIQDYYLRLSLTNPEKSKTTKLNTFIAEQARRLNMTVDEYMAAQKIQSEKQKAEIEERKRKIEFEQFKSKMDALVFNNEPGVQQLNFEYFFGLTISATQTKLQVYKKRLNKKGSVGKTETVYQINLHHIKDKPVTDKLFMSKISAAGGLSLLHSEYDTSGMQPENENLLLAEFLNSFRNRTIVRMGNYLEELEYLTISAEKITAKLEIEEKDDVVSLSVVFFLNEEKKEPQSTLLVVIDDPLWILFDNIIYEVEGINKVQFNLFLKNKNSIFINKSYTEFFETSILPKLTGTMQIVSSKYKVIEVIEEPKKRVYFDQINDSLALYLKFSYGDNLVDYDNSSNIISKFSEGTLLQVKRDKEYEENALQQVKEMYIKEIKPGVFTPRNHPLDFLFKYIPYLRENNFEIFGEENLSAFKINTSAPNVTFGVVSGIDWFDLETKIEFDGIAVPWDELIEAIKQKKKYISLSDGSFGMLPEEWIDRLKRTIGIGQVKENKIRFSNVQVNAVDELLKTADSNMSDKKFKEYVAKLNSFDKIEKQKVPPKFTGTLRDYQHFGFEWMSFLKSYNFGGILADDMGLGKTVQVLALLMNEKTLNKKTPSLIVAPTSVVFNWINEIAKFTPELTILNHTGVERVKDSCEHFKEYDIILTSYPIVLRDNQILRKERFNYIILDESQKIKNPLSDTAKAARLLVSDHRLCLTGTPIENNLTELWSQMSFLNSGMLGSLKSFNDNFIKPIQKEGINENAEYLRRLIYPFLLRRTKEVVAKELPPKTEIIHYCEMDPAQEKTYNLWRDSLRVELLKSIEENGIKKSGIKVIEALLRLRQICNHPKLIKDDYKKSSGKFEEFKELLVKAIEEKHKVLVFSQFVQMLSMMESFLDENNIKYECLTGSTHDRETPVRNFQEDPETRVFLISLKAGGFGLNLTAADYVFHYDPWWNPAVENQATDRAHRIGQNKHVIVYKFITKNSIEEKIILLQEKKRKLVENIISGESGILKNISKEDIEVLFS